VSPATATSRTSELSGSATLSLRLGLSAGIAVPGCNGTLAVFDFVSPWDARITRVGPIKQKSNEALPAAQCDRLGCSMIPLSLYYSFALGNREQTSVLWSGQRRVGATFVRNAQGIHGDFLPKIED
jgi:hypothetical protein